MTAGFLILCFYVVVAGWAFAYTWKMVDGSLYTPDGLSADLKALQEGAKDRGANAVIDIVSYFKKNEFRSATNYECHAGGIMSGVAFKATYAKVK